MAGRLNAVKDIDRPELWAYYYLILAADAVLDPDGSLVPVGSIKVVATLVTAALLFYGIKTPINSLRCRVFSRTDLRLRSTGATLSR